MLFEICENQRCQRHLRNQRAIPLIRFQTQI